MLYLAMQHESSPDDFEETYLAHFDGDEKKLKALIKTLPSFKSDYQSWYTKGQAVVKQVMPDRLADFVSYFEVPKGRKDITFQNYMIRDYLQGLFVTIGHEKRVVADGSAALPEYTQQLNMVKAARNTLESKLMDLTAVLQADLFDSEIETARALARSGHLRAAGAMCGVVIEKHLTHVCETHKLITKKKNPAISDLAQLLRTSSVITLAQERFVQSLADTRNICCHAKGREPTKDEITELVEGTTKVIKRIF